MTLSMGIYYNWLFILLFKENVFCNILMEDVNIERFIQNLHLIKKKYIYIRMIVLKNYALLKDYVSTLEEVNKSQW